MTPEEKAQEIYQTISEIIVKESNHVSDGFVYTVAKNCALIVAKQAHKASFLTASPVPEKTALFWTMVKTEIEKIK